MTRYASDGKAPRCLYVEASPRKDRSASTAVARAFLAALQRQHPALAVDTLDVWSEALPAFDGAAIDAKYAKLAGLPMSTEQQQAWQHISHMVERLNRADAVVISTPMWNFSIPYRLKHWIDLITQPGLTFSFDPHSGYAPLLKARPTLVVLSSAGDYANGPSRGRPDMASPYLREAFKFIGLDSLDLVGVGPTVGDTATVASVRAVAEQAVADLSETFLPNAVPGIAK